MRETTFRKTVGALATVAAAGLIWILLNFASIPLARAFSLSPTGWFILNTSFAAAFLAFCCGDYLRLEFQRNRRIVLSRLQRCHSLNYATWTMLRDIQLAVTNADPSVRNAYLEQIQEISDCRADINRMLGAIPVPLRRIQTASTRRRSDQCQAVLADLNARAESLHRYAFGR